MADGEDDLIDKDIDGLFRFLNSIVLQRLKFKKILRVWVGSYYKIFRRLLESRNIQ